MAKRSVFRVSYYIGGQPVQSFVCASSGTEASDFLGVRDGSAAVSMIADKVEVVGVDSAHPALVPIAPTVAPFESPKTVSQSDFAALQQQVTDLQKQLANFSKGAQAPVSVKS